MQLHNAFPHGPHDRLGMLLGDGPCQRPPIAQTRASDVTDKSPESNWGVATASYVFFNIYIDYLFEVSGNWQIGVSRYRDKADFFTEPNLSFAFMASLTYAKKEKSRHYADKNYNES